MFNFIKYIFEQGRKRAYSDIIVELTDFQNKVTRNREGAIVMQEVGKIIRRLKDLQKDEV